MAVLDRIPPAFEWRRIRAGRFASPVHAVKYTLHYVMSALHIAAPGLCSAFRRGVPGCGCDRVIVAERITKSLLFRLQTHCMSRCRSVALEEPQVTPILEPQTMTPGSDRSGAPNPVAWGRGVPPARPPAGSRRSEYRPRIADRELTERLASAGAVVIEGPRASGKTWTARQIARSEVVLDVDDEARRLARLEPGELLAGRTPRLIDEWQLESRLWNHVRHAVDDRQARGQFILTGSAVPPDDITHHSGAGRFSRLRLRPMSLFELGRSTGAVSLRALLGGRRVPTAESRLNARELAGIVCVGGWPGHLRGSAGQALRANRDYLAEVCRVDVERANGVRHNPDRVYRLVQSLARNVATYASVATVAAGVGGSEGPLMNQTARSYLTALERLMLVENQPPWAPHLRSRSRLRVSPKRHFADPSLAAAALRADPEHLLKDVTWFGFLFESMVVRDLRIYAQAADAEVYQYRDNTGLEVDAVVDAGPGRWAAFEVKLGTGRIENGVRSLLRFAERVDTSRCGRPAALGVVVHSGYAHTRPDGVAVIPAGALGP